jgi:hypothetical protein
MSQKFEFKWMREHEKEPSGKEMLFNAICGCVDEAQEEEERHSVPEGDFDLAEYYKVVRRTIDLDYFAAFVERLDKETVDLVIDSLTDEFVDCRTP